MRIWADGDLLGYVGIYEGNEIPYIYPPLGVSAAIRLIWDFGDALRLELLPYHFTSPSCRETLLSNMAKLKPTF